MCDGCIDRDVLEHSRRIEIAIAVQRSATCCCPRSKLDSIGDQLVDFLHGLFRDHRTALRCRISACTYLQAGHPLGQPLDEGVVNASLDIEAVSRRAGLASIAHLGNHRSIKSGIEIRVIKHDKGGVASKLHRAADHGLRRLSQKDAADASGACEREFAHPRVRQHCIGNRCRAACRQHIDHARRNTRFFAQSSHGIGR